MAGCAARVCGRALRELPRYNNQRPALASSAFSSVLLCQNSLRQRTRRRLIRRTGEVVWVVRCRQRVIGVNDRGLAVLRIDRDLEQVEQVARAWTTARAAGANDANVVRGGIHLSLCEACAVELRKVNVPARARIQVRS